LGYKLHLAWKVGKNDSLEKYKASTWKAGNTVSSERCIESDFFTYKDPEKFCTELKYGLLEGLCACVSNGVSQFIEGKVEACLRTPPLLSDMYKTISRSHMKWWQVF
jgi:hypothetical protein